MRVDPRREDGFVRGLIWLALLVAIAAIVVLDGMALFQARQATEQSADAAAASARKAYHQSHNLLNARLAADAYLTERSARLADFDASRGLDGTLVFSVTAQGHAETYAVKYLSRLGLERWIGALVDPTVTEASSS